MSTRTLIYELKLLADIGYNAKPEHRVRVANAAIEKIQDLECQVLDLSEYNKDYSVWAKGGP